VSQPKIAENSLKHRYFSVSKSFKVIDVSTSGKVVSSACYYLTSQCLSATFPIIDQSTIDASHTLMGVPKFDALVCRTPWPYGVKTNTIKIYV